MRVLADYRCHQRNPAGLHYTDQANQKRAEPLNTCSLAAIKAMAFTLKTTRGGSIEMVETTPDTPTARLFRLGVP